MELLEQQLRLEMLQLAGRSRAAVAGSLPSRKPAPEHQAGAFL